MLEKRIEMWNYSFYRPLWIKFAWQGWKSCIRNPVLSSFISEGEVSSFIFSLKGDKSPDIHSVVYNSLWFKDNISETKHFLFKDVANRREADLWVWITNHMEMPEWHSYYSPVFSTALVTHLLLQICQNCRVSLDNFL